VNGLREPAVTGHPFRARGGGQEYFYFAGQRQFVRVPADLQHLGDPKAYECFTPLVAGSRYEKAASQLDRQPDGRLNFGWKPDTDSVDLERQRELTAAGRIKADEGLWQLRDINDDHVIGRFPGSVFWNEHRRRWIMLVELFGQAWFAEGDTFVGPWVYARKIVSHERYSFYNIKQHPFFDHDGGKTIYFEGTYTDSFVDRPDTTPRYNYNQIMYRLSLDDPRLCLPAPIYRVNADGAERYLPRELVESGKSWDRVTQVAFFAVPPGRPCAGLIPIFSGRDKDAFLLQRKPTDGKPESAQPVFYALAPLGSAADAGPGAESPAVVPLYEYRHNRLNTRVYSTRPHLDDEALVRAAQPLCRVWRSPISTPVFDPSIELSSPAIRDPGR
jgi:hypothetical protein